MFLCLRWLTIKGLVQHDVPRELWYVGACPGAEERFVMLLVELLLCVLSRDAGSYVEDLFL